MKNRKFWYKLVVCHFGALPDGAAPQDFRTSKWDMLSTSSPNFIHLRPF